MIKVWKPTSKVFNEIGYSWKPTGIIVYSKRSKAPKLVGSSSKSKITESRISNSLDPTQSGGSTISDVPSSSPNNCTVRFGNDHIAKIIGYGDYQIGNVMISQVYYVEGLGHNLSSVGQFCDFNLEVAFCKHTCFIRDLEGGDQLKRSRGLVQGLPKLKYQKDHLCSACALSKSKKHSHKPKYEDSIQEKLYLLHMDLCRPMRIQSINGRKYILVIVDGYSRTDNGTEFVNQTLRAYYEEVEISHQTFVARTTQQNGVVERRNRTLVEAAHTMLIFSKALLFLWAEDSCNTFLLQLLLTVIAPEPAVLTGTPSSTTIDQDAPSTSTSQTNQETPSSVIPLGVEVADHDIKVAHMDNNPYVDFLIPGPSFEESSSQVVIPKNVHSVNQPPEFINKWTKDHPLDNVIGDPSRSVSTRHQL
ncbi:retrovirus-related pol polyprotein from transposon TNT 1-94 [Tanacetum coccineum]